MHPRIVDRQNHNTVEITKASNLELHFQFSTYVVGGVTRILSQNVCSQCWVITNNSELRAAGVSAFGALTHTNTWPLRYRQPVIFSGNCLFALLRTYKTTRLAALKHLTTNMPGMSLRQAYNRTHLRKRRNGLTVMLVASLGAGLLVAYQT